MSENNNKSRRKVKLVARDNIDSEYEHFREMEEDTSTKIPIIKIERLPAPHNNASLQDGNVALPVPMFSIKVEVEEFSNAITAKNEYDSENELVIDETQYTETLNAKPENVQPEDFSPVGPETKSLNSILATEFEGTKNKGKCKKSIKAIEPECAEIKGKIVSPHEVISMTDKILDRIKSKVNKIIGIEVKTMWGRLIETKIDKSELDLKLEKVFKQWNAKKGVLNRESPLFYKCYICDQSWWYLHPFREHLKTHTTKPFTLSVEDVFQQCSIIAYETGRIPEIRDIEMEGKCGKCNKDYEFHKLGTRLDDGLYSCDVCEEKSYTCSELKEHESGCRTLKRFHLSFGATRVYQCNICIFSFWSEFELIEHTISTHSVRSDVPMLFDDTDDYMECVQKYITWSIQFLCLQKKMNNLCTFCHRLFPSPNLLLFHQKCTKDEITCDICDVTLLKHCMVPKHYVTHTDMFSLVYRCCICKDTIIFLNEKMIKQHCLQHPYIEDTSIQYECMIIPEWMVIDMDRNNKDYEPILAVNHINKKYSKRLKAVELPTTGEVNAHQESPTTDVKIKEEMMESEEEEPKFFVIENDNADPMLPTEEYEVMLSNMFQASNTEAKIKTEIKSESEEEYRDDDLIQLQLSLYNNQQTEDKDTGSGDANSTESLDTMDVTPEDTLDEGYKKGKLYMCHKCGYRNYHKEFTIHKSSNCKKKPELPCLYKYLCTKCNNSFATLRKYIEHFEQHGFEKFICPQCKEELQNMNKLVLHIRLHIKSMFLRLIIIDHNHIEDKSKQEYKCVECKETITEGQIFKHWERHLVIFDVKVEVVSDNDIEDCDKVKSDRILERDMLKKVIAHLKSNESKGDLSKTCDVCGRYFHRKNDCKGHLIQHLLTDAWATKPKYGGLRCQICHNQFMKMERYKRHMREHGALPEYACELCDRTFSNSSNFAKHKKVHNQRAFRCDICNQKFQVKISLEKHMEVHKKYKPVQCPHCNKTCYTQSALKKHNRVHDKTKQNFKCFICGDSFFSLKDKWDHMWLKHKERRYKADCHLCPKKFRRFIDLKKHVKSVHHVDMILKKPDSKEKMQDIEEFLKNNACLNSGVEETLIVFD